MYIRRSLAALMLLVSAAAFADAGKVNGTLTMNGNVTKLKYAYAVTRSDPFDKKKAVTCVIATDTELPQSALLDDMGLMEVTMKTPLNGIQWLINDEKDVISLQIYTTHRKEGGTQFSSVGAQKLDLKDLTPSHVAGRIYLPKPDDFFGDSYQYDLNFDLPIVTVKAPDPKADLKGKMLPAGGGEPGKAYEAYRKVLLAGNVAGLKKAVSKDRAADMSDPDFPKMLPLVQAMTPKTVKITAGSVDGDTAVLLTEAKEKDETSTGKITLVKEAGGWKIAKEEWTSKTE
ncbi:MAG TPA: hypothetical protein VGJ81_16095 [Thermoanaerobaculia bacterium]|jgi:hypothetical protein